MSASLNYHCNENDAIRGERIIVEAEKITKPGEISGKLIIERFKK